MEKKKANNTISKIFANRKKYIFGILIALIVEAAISLGLPGILSKIIDGLGNKSLKWLISFVLVFLVIVLIKGLATVFNSFLSERMGRSACDEIRKELFKKLYTFSVSQHKKTRTGEFFEKIEGDVNILVGFFSNMLIDITSSSLMVFGILIVFSIKNALLGVIFSVIALIIFALFICTQKSIASLWNKARKSETDLFGDFSEILYASTDIKGLCKEEYAVSRFKKTFADFEHKQVKASFWGNLPATIFFSLLNVGEGIALIIGVNLLRNNLLTIGEVYLLVSYVGLLNMPFFHLKYQFTQMPMALSAFSRVNSVFDIESEDNTVDQYSDFGTNCIEFENVSFGYDNSPVLTDVSFSIESGENVLIEGRTGCGKSTILHLIAGLYTPDNGKVLIGGVDLNNIKRKDYVENVFYISQFYPVIEDTLRNNLIRFSASCDETVIEKAIKTSHLDEWMEKKGFGLDDHIKADDFDENDLQHLAWTSALISNPRILLVDEFDASIDDKTLAEIDDLMINNFTDSTIILISHKNRSLLDFHKQILVEENNVKISADR